MSASFTNTGRKNSKVEDINSNTHHTFKFPSSACLLIVDLDKRLHRQHGFEVDQKEKKKNGNRCRPGSPTSKVLHHPVTGYISLGS